MCRFLVFHGRRPILMSHLLTEPSHSIIKQSYESRERESSPLNGDGFGVGWYAAAPAAAAPAAAALPTAALPPPAAAIPPRPPCALQHPEYNAPVWAGSAPPFAAPPPAQSAGANDRGSGPEPCVFTSVSPAWSNMNLHRLAANVSSKLFFAHVRAATAGTMVNEANCHPFVHGQLMWMHNGMVEHFVRIKRRVVAALSDHTFELLQGTTDSEHCFMLFLTFLYELSDRRAATLQGADPAQDSAAAAGGAESGAAAQAAAEARVQRWSETELLELMRAALAKVIAVLNELLEEAGVLDYSLLNFAVTDGRSVLITRYVTVPGVRPATLYFSSGSSFERAGAGGSAFHMTQYDKRQHCYIISSEPVTADRHDWVEVPRNHMVVVTAASTMRLYPLPWPPRFAAAPPPSATAPLPAAPCPATAAVGAA